MNEAKRSLLVSQEGSLHPKTGCSAEESPFVSLPRRLFFVGAAALSASYFFGALAKDYKHASRHRPAAASAESPDAQS